MVPRKYHGGIKKVERARYCTAETYMDRDFLSKIAIEYKLSPEQIEAFVFRFDPANLGESEVKLSSKLSIGVSTFKKRMTEVYKKLQPLCPELASAKRGKVERLRAALQYRFEQLEQRESGEEVPQFFKSEAEPVPQELSLDEFEQQGVRQKTRGSENQTIANAENSNVIHSISDVQGNVYINVGELDAQQQRRSQLKMDVPMPRVRLPDNFVARPDAMATVKKMLLAETEQTLVVSAISGLGGLGKSVLATALVLDEEVQERFEDGILWVTLGQKPDLMNQVGDWIRRLDKSQDSYSVTTLEAAQSYLHNLLLEQRMLLVVDDVWNAANAEWFRVGGAGCRVLVTTREAQLQGAEYFSLDLMTEEEAVELVQQKLSKGWLVEDVAEFKAFSKSLGYLPLALDLAANQVRDGLSWAELRQEFEAERREVALELLDAAECWEELDEQQQRKYSLQACFNLSLKRLSPLQLHQFAWLGVLPEDVPIDEWMAKRLWDLSEVRAKRTLMDLQRRSLLTRGTETLEGKQTYRLHDLMHDTARGLIEKGKINPEYENSIVSSAIQNLQLAHQLFLKRYEVEPIREWWKQLSKHERYLCRYLTWHLEQAGWGNEIHRLLAASDDRGRNFWFETCEQIGQPAIFVEDVARGWELADNYYLQNASQALHLQVRYALITSTLVSLINNLPVEMMLEFLQQRFWSPEQIWSYIEQEKDESRLIDILLSVIVYLPKKLSKLISAKADSIEDHYSRARVFSALAKLDSTYLSKALKIASSIQDHPSRAIVLHELVCLDHSILSELFEVFHLVDNDTFKATILNDILNLDFVDPLEVLRAAKSIKDEDSRTRVLNTLISRKQVDLSVFLKADYLIYDEVFRSEILKNLIRFYPSHLPRLFKSARLLEDNYCRSTILNELAILDSAYFLEALETARLIEDDYYRAKALSGLAQLNSKYFPEALKATISISDDISKAQILINLSGCELDAANFSTLLEITRSMSALSRIEVLIQLTKFDSICFVEALETACLIQAEEYRAEVLKKLAQLDSANFSNLLQAACSIKVEHYRVEVLSKLSQLDSANFSKLLKATYLIQDEYCRAKLLSKLTRLDSANFSELLKAVHSIQIEDYKAEVLSELARLDSVYFFKALDTVRLIQDKEFRFEILSKLAQLDAVNHPALLEVARSIQDEEYRAEVLSQLAQLDSANFSEALKAARSIQDEPYRANILSKLAQHDSPFFSELLQTAQAIQSESYRANVLSKLAQLDSANFPELLKASRSIQSEEYRAKVLSNLARLDAVYFTETWEAVCSIQSEEYRAKVLSQLAKLDAAYFSKALETARSIPLGENRAKVLSKLAKLDACCCFEALEAVHWMQNQKYPRETENSQAEVLIELAQLDAIDFPALLEAACSIHDEFYQAEVLSELTQLDSAEFPKLLKVAHSIRSEEYRAKMLSQLTQLDNADFPQLLAAACSIQSEDYRAKILSQLVHLDNANFSLLLEVVRSIQSERYQIEVLSQLAKIGAVDFSKLLEITYSIQDEDYRAKILGELANLDDANFPQLLEAAHSIQYELNRAKVLGELTNLDDANFPQLLEAARSIQSQEYQIKVLSKLATIDSVYSHDVLERVQSIQNNYYRAKMLNSLTKLDSAYFGEAFETACWIQDEYHKAELLSELALLFSEHRSKILKILSKMKQKDAVAAWLSYGTTSLSANSLIPEDWQLLLHLLASCSRKELLSDLTQLAPMIIHLGGKSALRGTVKAIQEVCRQWP